METKEDKSKNKLKGGEKMGQKPIQLMKYNCERCKHEWIPRSEEKPTICPKCKSPYWDRPRKPSNQENAKK